jgi:hypothetical protein
MHHSKLHSKRAPATYHSSSRETAQTKLQQQQRRQQRMKDSHNPTDPRSDTPRRVRCRHWVSWSQARWTAREADAAAARRRAAEDASRELARRDAQIADATANSRVAAAAAARALNEATARAAGCEAEIARLRAAAEQQSAALAAAREQVLYVVLDRGVAARRQLTVITALMVMPLGCVGFQCKLAS